mmetsp:Transcript_24329/g.61712  ORF Transcript_24329/g.61712 Transcript_24329/m.61712 type:complete len:213 (+) Transcript_24329:115-753(+)
MVALRGKTTGDSRRSGACWKPVGARERGPSESPSIASVCSTPSAASAPSVASLSTAASASSLTRGHLSESRSSNSGASLRPSQADAKPATTGHHAAPLTLEDIQRDAGSGADPRAAQALKYIARLPAEKQAGATAIWLHRLATMRGLDQYVDPVIGRPVFTATFLRRHPCCHHGCRHCPHLGELSETAPSGPKSATAPGCESAACAAIANDW